MNVPTHAYLGTKGCGCFAFICVDDPEYASEIARDTRWVIKRGGSVERLPMQDAKDKLGAMQSGCSTCKPAGG